MLLITPRSEAGSGSIKAVLEKNITPVPIIQHPDVRRNLMMMKTYVEGMRVSYVFPRWCFDMVNTATTEEEKDKWSGLIEIITPIAKAYCTDKGCEVARTVSRFTAVTASSKNIHRLSSSVTV
jgi:alkylation response protein AidB-like acyl-CoA dehydrogenase